MSNTEFSKLGDEFEKMGNEMDAVRGSGTSANGYAAA